MTTTTCDICGKPGARVHRVMHRLNHNAIKMYDKQGSVLRVETTINNPRDMKVYRRKEGAAPDATKQWLRMRKGVSDLARRAQISQAANDRYLDGLAAVDTPTSLGELTAQLCRSARLKGRRVRALNPHPRSPACGLAFIDPSSDCHLQRSAPNARTRWR